MRKNFSYATKKAAIARTNGKCEGCGQPFSPSNMPEYDHILEVWEGGDNSPENCQVFGHKCCHRPKTTAATGRRAKADRIRDKLNNLKPESRWPKRRLA